jgi:tetratricopeptide (TPR) repeat protein
MKQDNNKAIIIALCIALLIGFFTPWLRIFINLSAYDMVFGTAGDIINSPLRYIVVTIPILSVIIIYSIAQNEPPSSKPFLFCLPLLVLIVISILICYKIGGDNLNNLNGDIIKVFGIGFWLTLISSIILTIFGVSSPVKNLNTSNFQAITDDNRSEIKSSEILPLPTSSKFQPYSVFDNWDSISSSLKELYSKCLARYKQNKRVSLIMISSVVVLILTFGALKATVWSKQSKIEAYIDAGQYEQAKGLLFTEIQKNPTDENLQFLLGKCYLAAGDIPNASQTLNQAISLNPSFKGETIELINKLIFKALDGANPATAETYVQLLLTFDPNATNTFSQKALDIGHTLSNSIENADKLVNLGNFSVSHNSALSVEWGNLLKVFIEKNTNSLDDTALSNICAKAVNWNSALNGEFSNLLFSKAKEEINKDDFDENSMQLLLNSATSMNNDLKVQAGSLVFGKLTSCFSNLKALGKAKFLSLFGICENFGVTPEVLNSDPYQLATAIKNHEEGDKDLAIQIFNNLLSKDANSIEGQISKQVLSPPPVGRINFNATPFNFMGTWSYGTGELTNNGVTIQLISAETSNTNIVITFTIKSNNQKQVFIYHPVYHNQEYFQELFPPYLQDDNGKIVYSIHGFMGGRQAPFNTYATKIDFNPNEQVTVKVDFPMISQGATTVKFVCPGEGGHQEEWSWDNLKLKNDIFD